MRKIFVCFLELILFFIPIIGESETYSKVIINQLSITYQSENGKWGYMDLETSYNSGAIFDNIWDECIEQNTPVFVSKDGIWGYVDRETGTNIIPYQFTSDHGFPCFRHGYALVSNVLENEKDALIYESFLINTEGERVTLPSGYDALTGVCGTKNTIVIGGHDYSGAYKLGLYRIGKGIIVPPSYDEIFAGDCNIYCFLNEEEKIGIIDADGNIMVDPIYENYDFPVSYTDQLSANGYVGYYTLHQADGSNIIILINDEKGTCLIFK